MFPALLAMAALAAGSPLRTPQPPAPPISAVAMKSNRFTRRRSLPRIAVASKPNGGYVPRTRGRRDRSLKMRSSRRKGA
jgi:hypothetical protein